MSTSTVMNHPRRASARSLLMLSGASVVAGALLWLAPHAQSGASSTRSAAVATPVYEGPVAPFTGGVRIPMYEGAVAPFTGGVRIPMYEGPAAPFIGGVDLRAFQNAPATGQATLADLDSK